jgi:acetolactate synthase regulatory subunit
MFQITEVNFNEQQRKERDDELRRTVRIVRDRGIRHSSTNHKREPNAGIVYIHDEKH